MFAMLECFSMARRPEFGKQEKVWSTEDLKEISRNLAVLSEHAVREVYQRAYRECAIINSSTFPPARSIQELVQAWKQLRKWRR
jgi:PP-loop superfamily ATP-utilizing enzyme